MVWIPIVILLTLSSIMVTIGMQDRKFYKTLDDTKIKALKRIMESDKDGN